MQRPIQPLWLLRQADELANRGGGPGQPRNSNLRRAASAAYYALFHKIALAMAEHLLPAGPEPERLSLTRSLDHAAILRASRWIASGQSAPPHLASTVAQAHGEQAVLTVADAVLELREQRHAADYDHLADFTKAGVLTLIDTARDAVRTIDDLRARRSPALHAYLALAALKTGNR